MFILILTLYAGTFAKGDSVSLSVSEFQNQAKCEAAGRLAVQTFQTPFKTSKYICVEK